MLKTRKFGLLVLMTIAVLLILSLAGCDTATEEPPGGEPEPDLPAEPEETSITIVIPEEPPSFNGTATFTGYERLIQEMVMLGLADLDPEGDPVLELAAELPTIENGGVVFDEENWTMDVFWNLRDDVFWADGEPVTADDVVFTLDTLLDPEGGTWAPGVDYIDSYEAIDDHTFAIYFNTVYTGYQYMFGAGELVVWPEHYCDASQGFVSWDCNFEPLSNGPYILEEWERGDHLTFVRNPDYFEEGKPYIDKVFIRIVPDDNARKLMVLEGEADLDFWVGEEIALELEDNPDVTISTAPTLRWLVQLWPNHAAKGEIDPETGEALTPHPVLSDVRVRKAMRMAIDMDAVIEGAFFGTAEKAWTVFFKEPYKCDIPEPVYDPAGAEALLEEAGWTDTDGDGVRECNGCTTGAPEGYTMSLEFIVYGEWGGATLENAHQLIGEYLEAVGFDLELSVLEGAVLWDTYEAGGLEQHGNFDLNMWDDGWPGTDPTEFLWVYYHTDAQIPDYGWNIERWSNEEFDALLDEVYILDEEYRKEVFCDIAELMEETLPTIPLLLGEDIAAHNPNLQGIEATVNNMISWNIADWTLSE